MIYKTQWFDRWARKQGLADASLCRAVDEMRRGSVDADLGSGLFKKRVARPGQGKSGGWRTLIASNLDNRWFFVFGFAKNERSNIDQDEEEALRRLASHLLSLSPKGLQQASEAGELLEVDCDA